MCIHLLSLVKHAAQERHCSRPSEAHSCDHLEQEGDTHQIASGKFNFVDLADEHWVYDRVHPTFIVVLKEVSNLVEALHQFCKLAAQSWPAAAE